MYNSKNLVSFILNSYDQCKIMAYVLNITVGEIEYCLSNKNHRIHSSERTDDTPSISFYWENSSKGLKLRYRDWARPEYNGDIFDKTILFLGLPEYDKCTFPKCCEFIINNYSEFTNKLPSVIRVKQKSNFELIPYFRGFDIVDANIWTAWGISSKAMQICKIYPIEGYSRNTIVSKWSNNALDPGYAMSLGSLDNIALWKLYFPLRDKHSKFGKFISNSYNIIEEYDNKQKGNILVLFKSKKEVAFFVTQCLKNNVKLPINVVVKTLLSESVILPSIMRNEINLNFRAKILVFDNDDAGRAATERFSCLENCYQYTYNIPNKDLTDTYKSDPKKGVATFLGLIKLIWQI